MNKRNIVLLGCVMAFLGSFLPWMTAQTMFGTMDVFGTDGDGTLTIILAIVGGILVYGMSKKHLTASAIMCGIGFFVSFGNMMQVSDKVADAPDGITASIGIGLYLCLVGFALSTIVAFSLRRDKVTA